MAETTKTKQVKSEGGQYQRTTSSQTTDSGQVVGTSEQAITVQVPGGPHLSFSKDAQKMIIVAMTITVIVATVEAVVDKKQKHPSIAKIFVGGFIAGGILLGMSYFLPEFAGGLAVVAMVTTLVDRGQTLSDIVTKVTGKGALPGGTNAIGSGSSAIGSRQSVMGGASSDWANIGKDAFSPLPDTPPQLAPRPQ